MRALLVYNEQLKSVVESRPNKIGRLICLLEETYLKNCWASTEQLVLITGMSSFDQRIQEMRKAQIPIECAQEGLIHYYQLQMNPYKIDWSSFRFQVPDTPIEPRPLPAAPRKEDLERIPVPVVVQEKLL